MEQALDDTAEGKAQYKAVISTTHAQIVRELEACGKATGKTCPKCGKLMVHQVKKAGKDLRGEYDFGGCSGWPGCRETAVR